MNILFISVISIYLIYSFLKREKGVPKEKSIQKAKKGAENKYELAIITAAIATVMAEKKYRIKNVFFVGDVDERKSAWKIYGRQAAMMNKGRR